MKYSLTFLVLFLVYFSITSASEHVTITWLAQHNPSDMILEGPDKGKFDLIINMAKPYMKEYQYKFQKMNWARFWTNLKDGEPICNVFAIKTEERLKFTYFGKAHLVYIPISIIMRKEDIAKLGNPLSYSLIKLLTDKRYRGLERQARSLGKLDPILKIHEPGSNLKRTTIGDKVQIQMLLLGRTDYILNYPLNIMFDNEEAQSVLGSMSIEETPEVEFIRLACPKNEWGKAVIDSWNIAMDKLRPTEKYKKFILDKGSVTSSDRSILERNYQRFVKID